MINQTKVVPQQIIQVALIDSYDREIVEAVENELKGHDIVCYIEGSIVYPISVARNDAARAREILRDSKRINHKRVQIIEDAPRPEGPSETEGHVNGTGPFS